MRTKGRPSSPRHGDRGFIMLGVIVVIAVLVAGVTFTLRSSTETMRNASTTRTRELVTQGLQHGLDQGLAQLDRTDPARFAAAPATWNLLEASSGAPAGDFLPGGTLFPTTGDFANTVRVRIGARATQRTQAPPGEDLRNAYGQIVELQIAADMPNTAHLSEERVAVGVQLPLQFSHSK